MDAAQQKFRNSARAMDAWDRARDGRATDDVRASVYARLRRNGAFDDDVEDVVVVEREDAETMVRRAFRALPRFRIERFDDFDDDDGIEDAIQVVLRFTFGFWCESVRVRRAVAAAAGG